MPSFDAAADLLRQAVTRRVTPAAVVEVGRASSVIWREAFGRLTYADDAPRSTPDTVFDLASLTKVIVTASLAMRAAEQGTLLLDATIASLEPRWRGADRAGVTVGHLLDHSSGLPAHARLFESASGRDEFLRRLLDTPLAFPPGSESRYSDPGFMLLGLLIEAREGAPLDALFAPITERLAGPLLFNPPASMMASIAPTEVDLWRGRMLRGEVHDENAAALGGVAGHAGLFGTAPAVGSFAQAVLQAFVADTWLAERSTLEMFATRSTVRGSSRALGWDTMLPTSSCGTRMSARAIGHTGFTGTSLWIDPAQDLYVVLLTNRVHPSRENEGVQPLRRALNDAVVNQLAIG